MYRLKNTLNFSGFPGSIMNDNILITALNAFRLRSLVTALGECVSPAWWKTQFLNETGLRFLERLYPRTPIRAAVHAAGRAACEAHDKAVGRVGVYHLFRLPEFLETEIHSSPSSGDAEFISRFRSCLGRQEELLEMLSGLCCGPPVKGISVGPKRIGVQADALKTDAMGMAASVYFDAFKGGKPAFPYFAAEQNRIDG
jgi:hypothetical protein